MRHFTQDEATETLAAVRPKVERLVERRRELNALAEQVNAVRATVVGNGGRLDPARVRELQEATDAVEEELASLIDDISAVGVQVKDLDEGLLDFPAVHPETGETVLLCWRLGEDEIGWWHAVEDGFAGRKPLPF